MLPCAFTRKLKDGESFTVCRHVYDDNIAEGAPLSCVIGTFERYSKPHEVTYDDGAVSTITATIHCTKACSQKDGRDVDMVEMKWEGGKCVLAPLAARGAA